MAAPIGNKYALGNNGGRPPMYTSPDEIAARIEAYFDYIKGESEEIPAEDGIGNEYTDIKWIRRPERPTITGLALFLGFDSKTSMYEYKKKEEFMYPIKRALTVIENNYENALDSKAPTGAIFALKNMDWSDKTQTELSGEVGIQWHEYKTYASDNQANEST